MQCTVSIVLAYLMAVYTGASAYYLWRTRTMGTPFKDSLTAKQRVIKRRSSAQRRSVFLVGVAIAVAALAFVQPFKRCSFCDVFYR